MPAGTIDDAAAAGVTDTFDGLSGRLPRRRPPADHLPLLRHRHAAGAARPAHGRTWQRPPPPLRAATGVPRPRAGLAGRRRLPLRGPAGGQAFAGPAVVEADTTTLAVPEGTAATVDHLGNIVLTPGKA
ncbi:hypothetical protein GCM10023203_31880 [Actinomycetospora straminea]|uniref:Hydantoinase/oxoprolinase-like protein n=1 Tax=Actinomycetospora straminea TaxID=663607 RepID=A0ABP9ER76_9PSEU